MREVLQHLPLCLLCCLALHVLECNSATFHAFTHLHWLKCEVSWRKLAAGLLVLLLLGAGVATASTVYVAPDTSVIVNPAVHSKRRTAAPRPAAFSYPRMPMSGIAVEPPEFPTPLWQRTTVTATVEFRAGFKWTTLLRSDYDLTTNGRMPVSVWRQRGSTLCNFQTVYLSPDVLVQSFPVDVSRIQPGDRLLFEHRHAYDLTFLLFDYTASSEPYHGWTLTTGSTSGTRLPARTAWSAPPFVDCTD